MAEIAGRRALRVAQKGFKRDATALLRRASDRAAGVLARNTGRNGKIDRRIWSNVAGEAGQIVQGAFTAGDGRSSVQDDGRPVSPYARLLMGYIAWATREAVRGHEKYMRARLPEDVLRWLSGTRKRPVGEMSALTPGPSPSGRGENPTPPHPRPLSIHGEGRKSGGRLVGEQTDEEIAQFLASHADLRIFEPDPRAQLDPLRQWVPAHRWNDPRGYQLSDRIWQMALRTRQQVDALIMDALRTGQGALELSRLLEQFLLPGRAPLRTQKPYGIDASYDAMRLARTEIARAYNQASWLSAYLNPYVDQIDVARSAWGDPTCPICPQHATIGLNGERLRPPYPVTSADLSPYHPHCMCNVRPVVTDDPAAVTERLRASMEEARELHLDPFMTPAAGDAFVQMLLGDAVWGLLRQMFLTPFQPALI